jgi:peptidoglycan/xylan/chitin deacetylase (PgdA/CDA1 family)
MSAGQIRACHLRGIEIGGHSREHPDLTAVPARKVDDEVGGAKRDLQGMGIDPVSFAYPFGFHDDKVRARVGRYFQLAFTCDEGLNHLRSDAMALRRTMVQPDDTLLDIEFRAALGWSPLNRLRSILRLRSRARGAWRRISRLVLMRRHPA